MITRERRNAFFSVIQHSQRSSKMYKLPRKLAPIAFSFYMAAIVAAVMSCVLTAVSVGFNSDYVSRVLSAYFVGFPVAFVSVLIVRPLVAKLVSATVK